MSCTTLTLQTTKVLTQSLIFSSNSADGFLQQLRGELRAPQTGGTTHNLFFIGSDLVVTNITYITIYMHIYMHTHAHASSCKCKGTSQLILVSRIMGGFHVLSAMSRSTPALYPSTFAGDFSRQRCHTHRMSAEVSKRFPISTMGCVIV